MCSRVRRSPPRRVESVGHGSVYATAPPLGSPMRCTTASTAEPNVRPALSAVQMLAELVRPELPFRKVSVRELIPDEMRDKYDAAVGTL